MSIQEERAWAGSQSSYEAALQVEANIKDALKAGKHHDDNEDKGPRLLSVEHGVATINISGTLMNSDSWMLEMFGATGYPEIRDALLAAANDPDVSQILLNIDSGGGAVSGCDDTAKLIRLINDKVKPVTAYTDSIMASAAYWLGSSAGEVFAGRSSLVGSIGVKATFKEYSKQNAMEGVTVTVIRAGKYKALADRNEPLSPEAEAQIRAVVDATYEVFVEHVAEARGKSYAYADKTMADGQEFIGKATVDVGLVDKIATFDEVMGDLRRKSVASLPQTMDNRGNHSGSLSRAVAAQVPGGEDMGKKALTEADIALLAAGVASASVSGDTELDEVETDKIEAEKAATLKAETDKRVEAEAAEVAKVEAEKAEVAKTSETVQYLTAQIKEKDAEILKAAIDLSKVTEKLEAVEAVLDPLVAIAVKSAGNMSLNLGGSAGLCEGMTPSQVVAEHARLTPLFQAKYPVGGVAATLEGTTNQASSDPRRMARVNAARHIK